VGPHGSDGVAAEFGAWLSVVNYTGPATVAAGAAVPFDTEIMSFGVPFTGSVATLPFDGTYLATVRVVGFSDSEDPGSVFSLAIPGATPIAPPLDGYVTDSILPTVVERTFQFTVAAAGTNVALYNRMPSPFTLASNGYGLFEVSATNASVVTGGDTISASLGYATAGVPIWVFVTWTQFEGVGIAVPETVVDSYGDQHNEAFGGIQTAVTGLQATAGYMFTVTQSGPLTVTVTFGSYQLGYAGMVISASPPGPALAFDSAQNNWVEVPMPGTVGYGTSQNPELIFVVSQMFIATGSIGDSIAVGAPSPYSGGGTLVANSLTQGNLTIGTSFVCGVFGGVFRNPAASAGEVRCPFYVTNQDTEYTTYGFMTTYTFTAATPPNAVPNASWSIEYLGVGG
jgi:hypothetical protein